MFQGRAPGGEGKRGSREPPGRGKTKMNKMNKTEKLKKMKKWKSGKME